MQEILDVIKTVGFPSALVIYFVWQSSKDKAKQDDKFTALEVFCREELLNTSKDVAATNKFCIELINDNKEVLKDNKQALIDVKIALSRNTEILDKVHSKMESN